MSTPIDERDVEPELRGEEPETDDEEGDGEDDEEAESYSFD
jgi:hypothetical protein